MSAPKSKRDHARAAAQWMGIRLGLASTGVVAYFVLSSFVVIKDAGQIPAAMFALSGVFGVLAGFVGTSAVFVASVSGKTIRRVRAETGEALDNALLSAVAMLFITSVSLVICGIFIDGWGARMAAVSFALLPTADLFLVALALKAALRSSRDREE